MPRRSEFIDSLLAGLAEIAQGMAETVADRIVNEFTPVAPPIPKPRRETKKPKAETKPRKRETKRDTKNWNEDRQSKLTHYDTLGVARTAEPEAIAGAYRSLARKYHPDHGHTGPMAAARIRALNAAWEVLGDAGKRATYDRSLSK